MTIQIRERNRLNKFVLLYVVLVILCSWVFMILFNTIESSFITALSISLGICVPAFLYGLRNWYLASASLRWPQVRGRILSAKRGETDHGRYTSKMNYPAFLYEYKVGDTTYVSDIGSFQNFWRQVAPDKLWSVSVSETLKQFPQDSSVQIAYHSQKPSLSVLRTGANIHNIIQLIMPLTALSVIWLIYFL